MFVNILLIFTVSGNHTLGKVIFTSNLGIPMIFDYPC